MRQPGCLSDLRIDRMLAGDLDPAEQAGAREHAATCAGCRARLSRLEAARAASDGAAAAALEALWRADEAPTPPARPRRWSWLGPALTAATAVGAVALVFFARGTLDQEPTGTRTKGRARIG